MCASVHYKGRCEEGRGQQGQEQGQQGQQGQQGCRGSGSTMAGDP